MPKKEQYCRCCGSEVDHTFQTCTNVNAMRRIILDQDVESKSYLDRALDLEVAVKQIPQLKSTSEVHSRIIHALLDLVEFNREEPT